MKNKTGRVAVFLSGRGSNFESIYKDTLEKKSNYNIEIVISDNPKAAGIDRSRVYGIKTFVFERKKYSKKSEFESSILYILNKYNIHLICLAGYMRIIGNTLLNAYKKKIINIHPSLLPAFPGLDAQKQAYEYGVKYSGCTVHFVDSGIDTGKIISQSVVELQTSDSIETLSNRILAEEHKIYPKTIRNLIEKMELK